MIDDYIETENNKVHILPSLILYSPASSLYSSLMSLLVLRKQRQERGPYSISTIRDIKDDDREDAGEKRIKEGKNREEGSFSSQKTETGERT